MGGIQFGIYSLPDTIAEINNLVTQISTGLTDLEGNLSTQIAGIKPAIKSIQRGLALYPVEKVIDVTISSVDMTKSVLVVDNAVCFLLAGVGSLKEAYDSQAVGLFVDSTTIRLAASLTGDGSRAISWQVVEYN